MITSEEVLAIGQLNKPHGIHGEISAKLNVDIEHLRLLSCIIFSIDGIFVPFFISSLRPKGEYSALIKIEGIEDENTAVEFSNKKIYALVHECADFIELQPDCADDEVLIEDLVGYKIADITPNNIIGNIIEIDDSTENVLFVVETTGRNIIYIPVVEDFIVEVDCEEKIITMKLPTDLINIQK